jgi:hypothetical protein
MILLQALAASCTLLCTGAPTGSDQISTDGRCAGKVCHFTDRLPQTETDSETLSDPSGPGVFRAAAQYNVRDQLLDCMTFDVTLNPWRTGGFLDAIVTDPPCEIS